MGGYWSSLDRYPVAEAVVPFHSYVDPYYRRWRMKDKSKIDSDTGME